MKALKFLSNFFKKPFTAENVKILTDDFLKKDITEIDKTSSELNHLIEVISDVVKTIKKDANGYPKNSINAQVWIDGFGLISNTRLIYEKTSTADYVEQTEKIADLWAESTLAVCSHYHHMVGPAMLAAAKMKEKSGKNNIALNYYKAIIGDFKSLTELDFSEEPINKEETIAIESLKDALLKSNLIDSSLIQSNEELLNKVNEILKVKTI